jgi:DNA-binding transcriptional ArsR family regulator
MMDVFAAVADPTRRSLLEHLRANGPLSITALCEPFSMSRQAVTKHLAVLKEAGLIAVTPRGRERIHSLQLEPLKAMEDWLAPYSEAWDERLDRLKHHLNGEDHDRTHH